MSIYSDKISVIFGFAIKLGNVIVFLVEYDFDVSVVTVYATRYSSKSQLISYSLRKRSR